MRKYEKKGILAGIFVIILCFFIAIFTATYLIIPKDTFDKDIKNYYIESAIVYFSEYKSEIKISIDKLIKKGYAEKKSEMDSYLCDYESSYLTKDNNSISLNLSCEKYTKEYKVILNEENGYDY